MSAPWRKPRAFLAATVSWLSHGLLDASKIGTQLFWPFSRVRVGLEVISIIGTLWMIVVLAALIGVRRDHRWGVVIALIAAMGWLAMEAFGVQG